MSEKEDGRPAQAHGRDLTTGSIPRHLIAFSMPMLAGNALQTAYGFINFIWVGQYLGKSALAAVTVSFPVIFFLLAVGLGLTMATNILISQYFGARNYPAVRKVVDSSNVLIGVFSLVIVVIGEVYTPHILRAMNTPHDVFPLAVHYMRIFLISIPFAFGMFLIRSMLQGIGDSKTPLYFQTASIIINIVLDPLLMFGLLGMPKLGLNGTAWASTFAQAAALLAVFIYLRRTRNFVAPAWNNLKIDWQTARTTIKIGIPASVQQSLVSIGMVFVTGIVNGFGENATAAFGTASRIDQLAFMPAMAFSMAVSTLAGQNIGARKYERVRDIFKWGCLLSGGITLLASALAVAIPGLLLRMFTNDATIIGPGTTYLRVVGSSYIFFAIMFISNGIINGSGHTMVTTVISLVSLWVVRVPMAYYLSKRFDDVMWVWVSMSVSSIVAMTVSLIYYKTGRWRRAVTRHTPVPPAAAEVPGGEKVEV